MTTLTAIIITKNEENMIVDCLESLKFCDEIIVIDSYSTDRTVDLAKREGAHIFHSNGDDFAKRRTMGLEKAKGKWVLYIDADERVSPALAKSIQHVVSNSMDTDFAAYKVLRKNYYFGNYEWPAVEKLERLFLKEKLNGWYGSLHESPHVNGAIGQLSGLLTHYTHRDLTAMVAKTNIWSDTEARLRFEARHPRMTWWRFFRVMATGFFNSFILQGGWKVGTVGWIESIYQAFSMFITYAKLWELQNIAEANRKKA